MPVSVSVSYELDSARVHFPDNGPVTVPADSITASITHVSFQCDNPLCKKNFGGVPRSFSWQEEKVQADADALPDDAFRILNVQLFDGRKFAFCCRQCVGTALDMLGPLKSPREQMSNVIAMPTKDDNDAVTVAHV
jgi:hypothetical protein